MELKQDTGWMDGELLKRYHESKKYTVPEIGQASDIKTPANEPMISPEFANGASRGAGGGLGSMVMSGGIASGQPAAVAAGVGLMALEGNAQAKQAEEEARAVEAQQRKQAQLAAINNLIGVSKGLSVM